MGKRFRVTRERVRQIQNAAVAKLREMMEENARVRSETEAEAAVAARGVAKAAAIRKSDPPRTRKRRRPI